MDRGPLRRGLLAATLMLVTGLGFGFMTEADADGPKVCGYVRYGHEPTSTVPSITYCERPCGGIGPHVPPDEVLGFHYEALVCVWDF